MKKLALYCLLQLMVATAFGQNYIKRTAEEPVYDVEVIVFGHLLAQPPAETIQQALVFEQEAAATVDIIPADDNWPLIKTPPEKLADEQSQTTADPNTAQKPGDNSDWEIPLNEEPIDYEVLVWYLKSQQLSGPVVNLLDNNPKYKPLLRQIWRQPTTPFKNPLYVKVNSQSTASAVDTFTQDDSINMDMTDFSFSPVAPPDIDDFQVSGQVALSEGRFTHLHIKFNYYRINENNEVLIYGSKQQRQVELNQWQYFDHQQFGILIKVTAIKAEELL
ncbi:MAG: hypothetical protein DWP95_04860 [Proteobacteria bacterium]|nr:MAG: hypothetical protein DWP95_04860 [Pseudomonadota bacterium]